MGIDPQADSAVMHEKMISFRIDPALCLDFTA
jgi:hypothetical protein